MNHEKVTEIIVNHARIQASDVLNDMLDYDNSEAVKNRVISDAMRNLFKRPISKASKNAVSEILDQAA